MTVLTKLEKLSPCKVKYGQWKDVNIGTYDIQNDENDLVFVLKILWLMTKF